MSMLIIGTEYRIQEELHGYGRISCLINLVMEELVYKWCGTIGYPVEVKIIRYPLCGTIKTKI